MKTIKKLFDSYPWLLLVLPGVFVIVIGIFLLLSKPAIIHRAGSPVTSQTPGSARASAAQTSSQAASQQNSWLSFFFSLFPHIGNTPPSTQTGVSTSGTTTNHIQSGFSSTPGSTLNTNSNSGAGSITQASPSTAQSANNSSGANIAQQIQIIFKTSNGGTQAYVPPSTPPVAVTWKRYINVADRYAIDYPANWQIIMTQYNGHEGMSIYLPGSDPGSPGVQYIGFGLANYYLLPAGNSQQYTYSYPVTVSNINGTMYTQGVLGSGSIATVFPYNQGFFGMGSSISNATFIYIYNHMLQSLSFGPQQ